MATVANANHFAWWNTRWIKIFEVEVLAADGNEYRVDHADFAPYTLFDIYRPGSRRVQTHVYAMTQNQRLMQGLEDVDAKGLERFFSSAPAGGDGSVQHRDRALFADFASRYFSHRNQRPDQRAFPFWLPSPALHNRHLSGAALYRDQSPVVDARLRFRELYRSDSELHVMRDEVVCRVQIPAPD